jgi:murein DD-endopeptidase MepM/ murein hydrolase activator NlpD
MARRPFALLVVLAVLVAAGTAGGDPGAEKARVDGQIDELESRVAGATARKGILTEQLSAAAGRVREVEAGVRGQEARLAVLDAELATARTRLERVERTLAVQTARLRRLEAERGRALRRLEQHVRAIYVADDPDVLALVLGTASFSDLIDNLDLLGRIGSQDERILAQVERSRDAVAEARTRSVAARREAAALERAVAGRAAEQRAVVERLAASRDALLVAQQGRRAALASIVEDEEHLREEIDALQAESARLAAAIRSGQAPSGNPISTPVTGSGALAWPVSGPVTSGFGPRWGRMHEGIDIAVPSGTPVGAAAPGTVIYAGWLGGYGNLVVVDHGGGLSTAYAHNSSFAVSVGQRVDTGSVLALSGNTGNSSGPHVHFEVRVGGQAVDPLGYL